MTTSWENSQNWYDTIVGKEGHYYHRHIILPKVLGHLKEMESISLLDLGCGQGILARQLPKQTTYCGIDLSSSLIHHAKNFEKNPSRSFFVGDICAPLPIKAQFTHAVSILSIQNVEFPNRVFKNVFKHLLPQGQFIFVLNHPCFRIPRQSHWGIDASSKVQFRRVDRYLTPLKIPISTHPVKGEESATTWTFHFPLSAYFHWLNEAGLKVILLEEWASDKKSTGPKAKMENRARIEFPLFLTVIAQKI